MKEIEVQLLFDNARLPEKKHDTDACFDLYVHRVTIDENPRILNVYYGFASAIPAGYKMVIVTRSSFTNYDLIMQNAVGQIDADFRGEWFSRLRKTGGGKFNEADVESIKQGMRLTQCYLERVMPVRLSQVVSLNKTVRGVGGYGSTGQ